MKTTLELSAEQQDDLFKILKLRFEKNKHRHRDIKWDDVIIRLKAHHTKLWRLHEMERTGGEPDIVGKDLITEEFIFYDCSVESPKGRRSFCYDHKALEERKEDKPKNSAVNATMEMGVELLTEDEYRHLQSFGTFDIKTSSWLKTPAVIRELGGAIFADYRYGQVFVYHNGAQSYYAARGFRASLKI